MSPIVYKPMVVCYNESINQAIHRVTILKPSLNGNASGDASHPVQLSLPNSPRGIRKRVCKACDRCRLKKGERSLLGSNMAGTSIAGDYTGFGAAMSVGITGTNAHELADDQLAMSYSKAAVAVFSNSIVPGLVDRAGFRSSILVARMLATPLYALQHSLCGGRPCKLSCVILRFVSPARVRPGETRDVQARLGIAGLIVVYYGQP